MGVTETLRTWLFEPLIHKIDELKKEIIHMAKTQADLDASIQSLSAAIEADADQDQKVVAAIDALLAKIAAGATGPDLETEVTALDSLKATLGQSNIAIKAELDKASA